MNKVRDGATYRHFSGSEYTVICTAIDEATMTDSVVYKSNADGRIWVRPLADFIGPNRDGVHRFTLVVGEEVG